MSQIFSGLTAFQQPDQAHSGADIWIADITYHPPGAPMPLLQDVTLKVAPNTMGLIFGRSGAGKSTLLQLLAGLSEPTAGTISFTGSGPNAAGLTAQQRMKAAGLVFQFPERHFIGSTIAEELTAGWPAADTPDAMVARQSMAIRAQQVLAAVGLTELPLETELARLSDGYKRRVALAVQLVRRPKLLLLDEPLAGLDWRTRADLVQLLKELKQECTLLVVSHDLRELAPLTDASWRMSPGGHLRSEPLPV